MTVHCQKGCGMSWPRHPALEVACPNCQAPVGSWCKRPSEHRAAQMHHDRLLHAYDAGNFGECPWACCRPNGRLLPSEQPGGKWYQGGGQLILALDCDVP